MPDPSRAVVYLARKVDGERWLRRFLASLQAHPAGCPHDLIVILKGYGEGEVPAVLRDFAAAEVGDATGLLALRTMPFDDRLFATEAFFTVAEKYPHDAFLFFVSWAQVLAADWARFVFDGLFEAGYTLVGGSAGFESLGPDTPFPNPSIRTTGFALRRDDWLSLERGDLSVKYGGNLFEAGTHSMTKQILRRGGRIAVAGRDGRYYPPERWIESRTFRLGRQENLLFSDNRTEQFDLARPGKRRRLAEMNWGAGVAVEPVSLPAVLLRRLRARLGR